VSRALAHRLGAFALSLAALLASAANAHADDASSETTGAEDIGEGLRAIDMLQDLKVAYDQRLADCLKAGETPGYCGRINSRATLDLTYQQFVEVVRDGDADRTARRFDVPPSRAAEAIAAEPACRAAR